MSESGNTISVIVPALNEEPHLRATIENIYKALGTRFSDYEIIIFNDASTDGTGRIAEELKKKDPHIKVIHNERNMGFGYNYVEGVRLARMEYVIMVPGDNEIPADAIKTILEQVGRADIIIPYTANPWIRPLSRRIISRAFVILINTLFGLNLRYYNGTCCHKTELIKNVKKTTWGFAYMAEILVRLLRQGASFIEVGVDITQRAAGKTKAFTVKNMVSVVKTIALLFWEVRVTERARYSSQLKRIEPVHP